MRITRDKMFMEIAKIVASRGTCDRAQVGAVLVDNSKIISIGYNGAPHGEPHCDDVGHLLFNGHCIRTIHAEENCLEGVNLQSAHHYTLYVTHYPCIKCQAILFEALQKPQKATMLVMYGREYGPASKFSELKEVHDVLQFTKYLGE